MSGYTRRRFLQLGAVAGLCGLAGCPSGNREDTSDANSPAATDGATTPDTAAARLQKLAARDGDGADQFGGALATNGKNILVSAANDEDPNGIQAGSTYVFEQTDGTWRQQAKLAPDSVGEGGGFGIRVGVTGETALVTSAQGLHRYTRTGDDWTQTGNPTLGSVPGPGPFTRLDERILLGQLCEGTSSEGFSTAPVYEIEWADGGWSQVGQLTPDTPESVECFGEYVAGVDGTLAISALDRDVPLSGTQRTGVVYLFERSAGSWTRTARLTPDKRTDFFGFNIAIADSIVAVNSLERSGSDGPELGTVYVFDRADGSKQAKLTVEEFRRLPGLATNGRQVLFGDWSNNVVYVFEQTGGTWRSQTKLVPEDIDSGDSFGIPIAVDGSTAVIGAHLDDDPNGQRAGSAYVATLESGQ